MTSSFISCACFDRDQGYSKFLVHLYFLDDPESLDFIPFVMI